MKTLKRYDRAGNASFTRTKEGYLLVDGIAVTPGLLTYRYNDGTKRVELIDSDEIRASMDTLNLKPVTLLHPKEMIGPKTIKGLSIGTVGTVKPNEDGALSVNFLIADASAIKEVESGMRDLSLGYEVKLDMTPGVHPIFGAYDARQYGRIYNHLAIVHQGRSAGANFRLDDNNNLIKEDNMKIELLIAALGAKSVDEVALTAELISAGMSEEDSAILAKSEVEKNKPDAEAEAAAEGESAEVESAEQAAAEKQDMQDRLDSALALSTLMSWHLKRTKLDSLSGSLDILKMDNLDASKAVLIKSGINIEDKSDDYIEARIDSLIDSQRNRSSHEGFRRAPSKEVTRTDNSSYLDYYKKQHKGSK